MTMSGGGTTWTYTYDANGMRTKRTNGSTTYSYIYNGSSLSQMTVGSNTLSFAYDASGTPMSVTYNGTNYYYVTNLQGDVTAILNSSGTSVVTYTYDAWGNILSTSGSMASSLGTHNPLRYRGYVYDTETELYYLQSRYYDPQLGRFINADAFTSTGQGVLGNNMFAYCLNNPVSMLDTDGLAASYACYRDDPFEEFFHQLGGGGGGGGYVGAAVAGATTGVVIGMVAAATASASKEKEDTKAEAIAITQSGGSRHQEFFPENPFEFVPFGLIMRVYVNIGDKNGGIIKWEIPGTKIAIFEWNQDLTYGPHYHVMLDIWSNKHLDPYHYIAGDPVPEPWNTLYFGYKQR